MQRHEECMFCYYLKLRGGTCCAELPSTGDERDGRPVAQASASQAPVPLVRRETDRPVPQPA